MNNSMFLNLLGKREPQTAYGQNIDGQANLPLQSSTMTVTEVLALMETHMSHIKLAVEIGLSVRNDEIEQLKAENEQLKAENEQLRLKVDSKQKGVNHHD